MSSKNTIKKIGIIGHGFVGKATDWGIDKDVDKFIVDPLYQTNIDQLSKFNPEAVFVCVPTPMGDDGRQDSTIIVQVINELTIKCPQSVICIKSTVLPDILESLLKINDSLVYSPEFLREKTANEDFINSEMIILGGKDQSCSIIKSIFQNNSKCKTKNFIFLDPLSASLVKYTINTFLATKVIFFNEIYSIFQKLNVDDSWEKIINAISLDTRLGGSHMNVPGHDGKEGYGGACFPKDTAALLRYSEKLDLSLKVLRSAIQKNNEIRGKYTNLDAREKEQNVSFDVKI